MILIEYFKGNNYIVHISQGSNIISFLKQGQIFWMLL